MIVGGAELWWVMVGRVGWVMGYVLSERVWVYDLISGCSSQNVSCLYFPRNIDLSRPQLLLQAYLVKPLSVRKGGTWRAAAGLFGPPSPPLPCPEDQKSCGMEWNALGSACKNTDFNEKQVDRICFVILEVTRIDTSIMLPETTWLYWRWTDKQKTHLYGYVFICSSRTRMLNKWETISYPPPPPRWNTERK